MFGPALQLSPIADAEEPGRKLKLPGDTLKADAPLPLIVQLRPVVAKGPLPDPPIGVTWIAALPVVPAPPRERLT